MDVKLKILIIIAIVFVLLIPINAFALEVSPKTIDMSTSYSPELIITGDIEQYLGTTRLLLTIISPDNAQTEYDIRIVGKGPFSKSLTIDSNWIYGDYTIYGKYGETNLDSTSFTIETPYDPRTDVKTEAIESSPQTESKETILESNELKIPASFVDQTKDPQYYIDRYNKETTYKKWFDDNYSEYSSIYQAVGLESSTCGVGITLVNRECQSIITNSIDAYRTTNIENFPDPKKDPEYYIERYNSETEYKKWFDALFPNESIESIVNYKKTHIEGFPDNSKSPEYYIEKYYSEYVYKKWFDDNFPRERISNIVGINEEDTSTLISQVAKQFSKEYQDEKSTELINLALTIDPDNTNALFVQGWNYYNDFQFSASKDNFKRILKIDPTHVNATTSYADILLEENNLSGALPYYEKALKLDPEDLFALSGKGSVLVLQNNQKGMEYINKAIELYPNTSTAYFLKGWALDSLGEYEDAIVYYKKSLEFEPTDTTALNNIGWIYAQLGKNDDATLYFEKVLEIDPSDEYASNNLKDVQEGNVVKSTAYESKLKEASLSSTFPEVVDSRCDLVYLIIKEYDASPYGLLPSEGTIEKIQLKAEEYQQRISDEPWKADELTPEYTNELKTMLVDSIMKKYNIDKKFRTGMFDLIKTVGVLDQDYSRGLFQLQPEDYAEDVECGKLLKLYYFDSLNEINIMTYGESAAKKMEVAINEAIENAESKKSSNPISTFNSKTGNSNSGGGCLIATATYGSELAPQVQQLREIRDNSLLTTTSGIQFMNTFNDVYYSFSPVIADYERENPLFKEMVNIAITPMVSSLSILNYVDMDSESSVIGYGISLIILNGLMYVGIPASVIVVVRRF